jgi:hypothetical protein
VWPLPNQPLEVNFNPDGALVLRQRLTGGRDNCIVIRAENVSGFLSTLNQLSSARTPIDD